jgi:hypothetical protein
MKKWQLCENVLLNSETERDTAIGQASCLLEDSPYFRINKIRGRFL